MGEIHYAPVNTSAASFVAGFDGWVGDFEMVISDEIAGLAGADGEEEVPSGHGRVPYRDGQQVKMPL